MPNCHIVICSLSGCIIFFHIFSEMARFLKKFVEYKMCSLMFSTTFDWNISHSKKNWANTCYSFQILMKLEFSQRNFEKYSNIKCYATGAELFHVDRWTDRQMDSMKLIVAFHSFVNVPKKTQLDMEYSNLGCAWFELCSHDWGFCGFVQPLCISGGIVPVPSPSLPNPLHIVTAATAAAGTTTCTWYSILAVDT